MTHDELKHRIYDDVFLYRLFKTLDNDEHELIIPVIDDEGNHFFQHMNIDTFISQVEADETLMSQYLAFSKEGRKDVFADVKID